MNQTAQLFEIDNIKRFRKFWERCGTSERTEIYKIVRQEMGDGVEESLSKKELNAQAKEVIAFLNLKAGTKYRPVETHLKNIRARLQSGITVAELRAITAKKCREWRGTDQEEYLRPATLYCEKNCENYLGGLG